MRDITKSFLVLLIVASTATPLSAADNADYVMRKSADGKMEFLPGTSSSSSSLSTPNINLSSDSTTNVSLMRAAGTLLVAAGVAMLLFWQHKRTVDAVVGDSRRMKVLERLPLGARRELFMVQACDRILVIGCQANQMTLISDLVIDAAPAAKSFNEALEEKGVEKAPLPHKEPVKQVVHEPVKEAIKEPVKEHTVRDLFKEAREARIAREALETRKEQGVERELLMRSLQSSSKQKSVPTDTVAISAEARKKDWPELKGVS